MQRCTNIHVLLTPEGSNTALNSDIMKAENITLDEEVRQALEVLADTLLQEEDHLNFVRGVEMVIDKGWIADFYQGLTMLQCTEKLGMKKCTRRI